MTGRFSRADPAIFLREAVVLAMRMEAAARIYATPETRRRGKVNYAPGVRTPTPP